MNIGDVTSQERGSGARFNTGKVRLDYVPARVLAHFYRFHEGDDSRGVKLLDAVADYEERKDGTNALLRALYIAMPLVGGVERWRAACDTFDFGAGKYAAWNWAKGMAWSIPLGCIKRHAVKIMEGEPADDESGVDHWGHVACNIVMLLHYADNFREGDDRPPAQCFAKEEPETIRVSGNGRDFYEVGIDGGFIPGVTDRMLGSDITRRSAHDENPVIVIPETGDTVEVEPKRPCWNCEATRLCPPTTGFYWGV